MMDSATYQLNENMYDLIMNLEEKIPTDIIVESFNSSSDSISFPCVSTSYDSIAEFIVQLKSIDCIDDAYVSSVAKVEEEATGETVYNFTVTAIYVNPNAETIDETAE